MQNLKIVDSIGYVIVDMDKLDIENEDLWWVIDNIIKISSIKHYLFFKKKWNIIKCSIRSKEWIADEIAKIFWWGWHAKAAGFKIEMLENNLEKMIQEIIQKIVLYLKSL